jgi:penicillin-binding protein 1A
MVIFICGGLGLFKGIISSAPSISSLSVIPTGYTSIVYDSDGNEVQKLVSSNANRRYVSNEKIPQNLKDAFVAIEDERFYEHNGIDFQGILRAGISAIKDQDLGQGASTITQQLLKNNVFENWTNEKTGEKIVRKLQEQYLAIELEKTTSKEMILEYYMNTINLGQGTLGVEAASLRYFQKSVSDLTLSECATIAAITKSPVGYNPITHPDINETRRKNVLDKMLEFEMITQEEYDIALADDVYSRIEEANEIEEANSINSYFVDELIEEVLSDLKSELGYNDTQAYNALYSGGLKIYSTQDTAIQEICDNVFTNEENYPEDVQWYLNYELTIEKANGDLENHSTEMFKTYFKEQFASFNLLYSSKEEAYEAIEEYKTNFLSTGDSVYAETVSLTAQPQVSLTIADQSTGKVVAIVGGRGEKSGSRTLNRATNTLRQPGSTYKVLSTYAPALDSAGLTLASIFNDAPYYDVNGRPVSNWWGEEYRGLSSIRTAIKDSMNIITVKCLTQITPELGFEYAKNFGFTTLVESELINGEIYSDINQSLALGGLTHGVTNLELNAAYASIANKGTYIEPTLYSKILDHDGNVLIDNENPEQHQVIKETTAFLLTDAMEDVMSSGTATSAKFSGMSMAGKTGTTTNYVDVWFSGYTPYYTATTWAGYDNNEYLRKGSEQSLAKSLWKKVMEEIHIDLPNKTFEKPDGIVTQTVCSRSGKLPIAGLCDSTLTTEYFAEGTVPTETCDVHYSGFICAQSGLIASENCPFKVAGTIELLPIEDESLLAGSVPRDANGNPLEGYSEVISQYCEHDDAFFAQPDAYLIIEQQLAEMNARNEAAAAEAAAAAAAAAGQ